ncbi:MAG TPA: DNA polymerase III subunit delta [Promineifilum sp.]|mgnify:CR=1 FL=1|nr:DNA polymerase III subunit delta [Promineifilum sp.]HRO91511.1 DNA polymerase III subunit delta [Promineifilum sp.]HRQ13521.1 DNA polymerase III subunit delta [Promineifilum sp.]
MFHLFHGQDTYSQRETLTALLAKEGDPDMLSLNTTRLDNRITFAELQSACDAMPFLSRVRVVLVQDLFSSIPDKAFMEKLEAYLPELPKATRLIFLESQPLSDSHRIVRLAQEKKIGYVRKFDPPKGGDLERWVRIHVEERGGRIAPQAAVLLATNVAGERDERGNPLPSLAALTNEIEKLVLYKGSEATIEAADVALLSPYAAEDTIFELVDALGNRQTARAAELFQDKINEGADPFYLFSMFIRQFRLLIQARYLLDQGERAAGIAEQMKQKSFVAEKLARQARNFTLPQLEQIYRRLLEIDVDAKTGKADLMTSLYLLVAGLTVE